MKTSKSGNARKAIQIVLAAGVAVGAAPPAAADIFLKINGLEGESTNSKHAKEIVVDNFSYSVDPKECPVIYVSKLVDKASPAIAEAVVLQKRFTSGVLAVNRNIGDVAADFYTLTMSNITVVGQNLSFCGDCDSGYESITLWASTLSISYQPMDSKTGKLGPPIVKSIMSCSGGAGGARPN